MTNANISDEMKLQKLEKDSIMVRDGEVAVFPQFSMEETIDTKEFLEFEKGFATNNSSVCFVHKSKVFVNRYTLDMLNFLRSMGFHEKELYVPFSNGDYPKSQQGKWNLICRKANY